MSEMRYASIFSEDGYGTVNEKLVDLIFGSEDYTDDIEFAELEWANKPNIRESPMATKVGEGSVDNWGRAEELYYILHYFLGSSKQADIDDSGDYDVFDIIFTPRDNISSFSLAIGRENIEFLYRGQVMNELEVSSEVGENLIVTFGSVGKGAIKTNKFDGEIGNVDELEYTDIPVFVMDDLTVEIGGTEANNIQTCNVSLGNDIDTDYHVLGSKEFNQLLHRQRREITEDLDFKDEDESLYQDYIDGVQADVRLHYTSPTSYNGYEHEFEIHIPRVQYREYDGTVDGKDPVRSSTSGRALAGTVEFTDRAIGEDFSQEDKEIGMRLVFGDEETQIDMSYFFPLTFPIEFM